MPCRKIVAGLVAIAMLSAVAAHAAHPRLRRLVVVGDSILAGFSSGSLTAAGRQGQLYSAPLYVAHRAGVALAQPLMSSPGVPAPYVIDDANANGRLDSGEVRRTTDSLGSRKRPGQVVRNLAVPGEDVSSVFDEISPTVVARRLVTGDRVEGRDVLKFLILGVPPKADSVSQVTRAQDLAPTFILVWLGNNDILDMATDTNPDAADIATADFGRRFRRLLNNLADTGAGMAVANLPDVTGIAALRHAAPDVTSCRQADGTLRAVAADDLMSIDTPLSELPVPPCTDVLAAPERDRVRATVMAFNAEVAAAITETEQRRGVAIAPVETFTLFDQLRQQGLDVDGNGIADLSTSYLGGLFSLDGVHPTRTTNALIANAFIDSINQRFGDTIPRVNIARVASNDPFVGNSFRPAGEPPFGLIESDTNDLAGFFDQVSGRVSRGAEGFRDDATASGKNVFNRIKRFFRRAF